VCDSCRRQKEKRNESESVKCDKWCGGKEREKKIDEKVM